MEKSSKYYDKVYSISKEYAKTPNESIYANIWRYDIKMTQDIRELKEFEYIKQI